MERVTLTNYRTATSRVDEGSRIRYAAPPTGSLRWQLPQAPSVDRSQILRGDTLPEQCPQGTGNAITLPSTYNFTGNEDCLFLNVYAPQNATDLPVLVWIHGGGYGLGQGSQDMSAIINANGNKFIAVAIQYRVSISSVEHEGDKSAINVG